MISFAAEQVILQFLDIIPGGAVPPSVWHEGSCCIYA
jgi:hypothetical protein